ncbi:MAG: AMP-binding protein, partial [Deltaproteobacteria bacterium]|nr:AMP-binding protein [Deltaproteobacteria bacterium]
MRHSIFLIGLRSSRAIKRSVSSSSLAGMGIQPGDHVALCAPNSYQWLTFYFGVLKAGAVAVTLSNTLKKDELTRIMDDARP